MPLCTNGRNLCQGRCVFLSASCIFPRKDSSGDPVQAGPLRFCQPPVQLVPFLSSHKFTLCWVSTTAACRWSTTFFLQIYQTQIVLISLAIKNMGNMFSSVMIIFSRNEAFHHSPITTQVKLLLWSLSVLQVNMGISPITRQRLQSAFGQISLQLQIGRDYNGCSLHHVPPP